MAPYDCKQNVPIMYPVEILISSHLPFSSTNMGPPESPVQGPPIASLDNTQSWVSLPYPQTWILQYVNIQ